MLDQTTRPRAVPTPLKWVSLALLIMALLVLPTLVVDWLLASLDLLGGSETGATYYVAAESFVVLFLGFVVSVVAWVTGCIVQRKPPAHGRRAFRTATVAVAGGLACAAALWVPIGVQAASQDDLVADLHRLDRMMPAGYQLKESDEDQDVGSGFVEPSRAWAAPRGAQTCKQLGPILRRWAGHKPEVSDCSFDTTRHGWDITVTVDPDAEAWDYPKGRARIELETAA